jgi:hypothetical protein
MSRALRATFCACGARRSSSRTLDTPRSCPTSSRRLDETARPAQAPAPPPGHASARATSRTPGTNRTTTPERPSPPCCGKEHPVITVGDAHACTAHRCVGGTVAACRRAERPTSGATVSVSFSTLTWPFFSSVVAVMSAQFAAHLVTAAPALFASEVIAGALPAPITAVAAQPVVVGDAPVTAARAVTRGRGVGIDLVRQRARPEPMIMHGHAGHHRRVGHLHPEGPD